jgi:hypothetical protein
VKRIIIFITLVIILSACKNPFEATAISMEKAWALSQGKANAIDCSKSEDHSFMDGFEYIMFNCKLNVLTDSVEIIEIYNSKFDNSSLQYRKFKGEFDESTFGYGQTVIGGETFESQDYYVEYEDFISDNPAISNYGQICVTTDCPRDYEFKPGYEFRTVFREPGSAVPRKLIFQYALWDGKKRIWLGTSKSFALRIPADPELVAYEAEKLEIQRENQIAAEKQYAEEQIARNSYDEGYAFIWESSADFLLTMPGLATSFDIKGNPIKREMTEFCGSLYSDTLIARGHLSSSKESSRREWNKGCFKAAMKITLSDLNGG